MPALNVFFPLALWHKLNCDVKCYFANLLLCESRSLPQYCPAGSPNWSKLLNSGFRSWRVRTEAESRTRSLKLCTIFLSYYYHQIFFSNSKRKLGLGSDYLKGSRWFVKYKSVSPFWALIFFVFMLYFNVFSLEISLRGCYHSDILIKSLQCFEG